MVSGDVGDVSARQEAHAASPLLTFILTFLLMRWRLPSAVADVSSRCGAEAAETLEALEELRIEAGKRGWWSTARLPEPLAKYVGLETEASTVRSFELELIPGLLQTEPYARELYVLRGTLTPDDLDRRVKARLRRQERLTSSSDDPLQLCALLSEAALQRCVRYPSVAPEQFNQLIGWARLPHVEIRVLPFDVGLHRGMAGAFSLLSFPEGLLPDVGWQENPLGGHVVEDPTDVAFLAMLFAELRGKALGSDESLTLFAELLGNITHHTRKEGACRRVPLTGQCPPP